MKRLLTLVAFFATVQASAQQVNPVPDYVFRNQMSVGRGTVTDTAAYFSIGPRYGANKGFMPPIVGDTATFSSGKRNGLLIFSVQKNKFLYWDSVRVQWSDMAGSSGSYITGSGITGYLPQFSASTTLDTSALFSLGNRLGIGSSTFAYTSTNTANIELNGTAGGILGFKRNDSARGYLWHTGDNMELANTTAGSISFNTNSATRGSISSAGVWRLHNLAGTGDRVVVASSNGTLSASTSVTGLVDTTTISTRAWRQKGDDSLGAIIATKGSGTVTSVATGYGLSGGTITTTGTLLVDTLNIATRAWRQKGIDSVVSIIPAAGVGGSGTTNYVPKFTASSTIGNSQIFDNGTNVGIGITTGMSERFNVASSTANANASISSSWASGGAFLRFGNATNADGLYLGYNNPAGSLFGGVGGANGGVIMGYGAYPIGFGTNGTERLRIFANGRVGINTTTDAGYQLDINGTLRSVNGANFATTSGNVGIGTASPATYAGYTTLAVNNATNGGVIDIMRNNSVILQIFGDAGASGIGSIANVPFTFKTNNTEQGRINTAGEFLLNSTNSDAGDYKLQVSGNIYNTGSAVLAATSGQVQVGTTAWPTSLIGKSGSRSLIGNEGIFVLWNEAAVASNNFAGLYLGAKGGGTNGSTTIAGGVIKGLSESVSSNAGALVFETNGGGGNVERGRINSAGEWIIDASGTDAGDYKLQVVGNALVTAGKLDITTNTAFGLSVSRSGTSVVAGQINNSNGILYYGAESSTGGGLFTGSSAYAAVIGSGAAYPLQFATDNVTRATINTNGELLIATTTDNGDFKLQVNGSALVSGSIQTANPVSGTAVPWRLGSVVATNVQLDTANYVEVNINGTFYRLAIVTPL